MRVTLPLALVLVCSYAVHGQAAGRQLILREGFPLTFRGRGWSLVGATWTEAFSLDMGAPRTGAAALQIGSRDRDVGLVRTFDPPVQDATLEVWIYDPTGVAGTGFVIVSSERTTNELPRSGLRIGADCGDATSLAVVQTGLTTNRAADPNRTPGWRKITIEHQESQVRCLVDGTLLYAGSMPGGWRKLTLLRTAQCEGAALFDDLVVYAGTALVPALGRAELTIQREPRAAVFDLQVGIGWLDIGSGAGVDPSAASGIGLAADLLHRPNPYLGLGVHASGWRGRIDGERSAYLLTAMSATWFIPGTRGFLRAGAGPALLFSDSHRPPFTGGGDNGFGYVAAGGITWHVAGPVGIGPRFDLARLDIGSGGATTMFSLAMAIEYLPARAVVGFADPH